MRERLHAILESLEDLTEDCEHEELLSELETARSAISTALDLVGVEPADEG